jgi:DNA topoisomerase-3
VKRRSRIRPRDFWEVRAEFVCAAGVYEGRWLDTKFKKDENDPRSAPSACGARLRPTPSRWPRGKQGSVTEEAKPTTSMSPGLFDLTSLQREANSRFGFSAKNTLGLAQALYEKHKVLTYPRTDSRHLPEDYLATVKQTLEVVKENNNYHQFAKQILDKGWVKPNKRIFDNTKIRTTSRSSRPRSPEEPVRAGTEAVRPGDAPLHGRVLPGGRVPGHHPLTEVSGHTFKTEGKVMTNPGWLAIYGKEADGDDKEKEGNNKSLVPVAKGEN